jgi:hypothetical protein
LKPLCDKCVNLDDYSLFFSHTNKKMSSTIPDVLQQLTQGKITQDEASVLIAQMTALEVSKKNTKPAVYYKVSQKGAISIYGIRKLPITLYVSEIDTIKKLICHEDYDKFLEENKDELSLPALK